MPTTSRSRTRSQAISRRARATGLQSDFEYFTTEDSEPGPEARFFSRRGRWNIFVVIFLSIALAVAFDFAVRSLIPDYRWTDLQRYIDRFSKPSFGFIYVDRPWYEIFFHENGWSSFINFLLGKGLFADQALEFSCVLSLSMYFYTLIRATGRPLTVILTINPAVIDLFVSQTRSAFAFSLAFISYFESSLLLALAIIVLATTIHTAAPLAMPVLVYDRIFRYKYKLSKLLRNKYFVAAGFALAATIIIALQSTILAAFDDRRAEGYVDRESGLMFAVAWVVLIGTFLWSSRNMLSQFGLALVFFGSMFLVSQIFGTYGSRYASITSMLLPIAAFVDVPKGFKRDALISIYVIYSLFYFSYWLYN